MPTRLRHSMCVCRREGDKGAVVEALLREQQAVRRRRGEADGAGPLLPGAHGASEGEGGGEGGVSGAARALLLVREGLALAEVIEELEASSRGGTTPLHPSAPRLCQLPSLTLARARLPSLPPARQPVGAPLTSSCRISLGSPLDLPWISRDLPRRSSACGRPS